MRVSALERRSSSRNTPMQFVSDLDETKPEVRYRAKVVIKQGKSPQLKFKIPKILWKTLGAPPFVDIVGTPADGLKFVPGRDYKTQHQANARDSVVFTISARKIGVVPEKRPVTEIAIMHYAKALIFDPLPPEWCEIKPKVPPPEPIEAGAAILPDQTPQPEPEPEQFAVKVSVRNFHKNQYGMFFNCPSALLGQLGDPKRLRIEGTPHHGFRLVPCDIDGIKLNYATGKNVYFQTGLTNRNIDKKERLPCPLEAVVKDGVIAVSGAGPDWIHACGEWAPRKKEAPPAMVTAPMAPPAPAVPNGNGNGHAAPNGNGQHTALDGLPKGNTPVEVSSLVARIQHALADVRLLRAELEKRTGLKFKLTSNLTFTLDV